MNSMTKKSSNWGGRRVGAGRPKKRATVASKSVKRAGRRTRYTPLEYMLAVMNDPTASLSRRARMAIVLAPYFHRKVGSGDAQ